MIICDFSRYVPQERLVENPHNSSTNELSRWENLFYFLCWHWQCSFPKNVWFVAENGCYTYSSYRREC